MEHKNLKFTSKLTKRHKVLMPSCGSFQKADCTDEDYEKSDLDYQIDSLEAKTKLEDDLNSKLKAELSRYRDELREYTSNTKDLEEKYMKINIELNEMKEKHERLISERNLPCGDFETLSETSSSGSEYSLQPKSTQVFHRSNSFLNLVSNDQHRTMKYKLPKKCAEQNMDMDYRQAENVLRRQKHRSEDKENVDPSFCCTSYDSDLKNLYKTLKTVIDDKTNTNKTHECPEVNTLKNTISNLKNDSERFCTVIEQQENTLKDYRMRFIKAQKVMKEQQIEIEKLNSSNQQLERDASASIDQLRLKVESKLRDVALLSEIMRDEQIKKERAIKENCILNERIQSVQAEANQLKLKLEEMTRRKIATITRLKTAERDLKIFKNYNAALKQEKRKLTEEMKKMSDQIENMQNTSKRNINRQREHNEKQRRELQKRIFELEMKLNRSQSSTTCLIQERDSLIAELQSQLNNLVHNFEVSQKHIRVLRRHIYSMSGNNNRQTFVRNRVVNAS